MSQFHLIAPSGYCINQDAAQRGVQRLLESGHQVENQTIIPRRQQRFAGTEAQRLNDINSLVNLTGENQIVLAVRGGYGASRLLESIDWQGLALRQQQDPLLICGHSDFTVIQLGLLALHNVITFSGPMLAGNFGAPELDAFTVEHFWRALRNSTYSVEWQGNGPHWDKKRQARRKESIKAALLFLFFLHIKQLLGRDGRVTLRVFRHFVHRRNRHQRA